MSVSIGEDELLLLANPELSGMLQATMDEEDWVTIANFLFPHEARIAQAHLEAYDIPVFLENVNLVTNDWLLANAIGGVPLKVPRSCVEVAESLLREPVGEDAEDGED